MKGIDISDSFVNAVLGKRVEEVKEVQKIEEKKVEEKKDEVEEHVCPLCESKLAEAISEEKLKEHVDYFLSVINENFEIDDAESLDEELEEGAEKTEEEENGDTAGK
jgi:hypothetical protein